MFLWVPVSLILAALTFTLFVYIFLVIGYRTKPNHRFKHFILRSAMNLFLKFYHIKLNIVGEENIPNDTYIVYSNHKSNRYHHVQIQDVPLRQSARANRH